jgi:hypothetical protein
MCAGCRSEPEPENPTMLDPATARRSLDAALGAWKRGAGPGLLPGLTPPTHLIDSHSTPGEKLQRYEILGEVSGEAGRCFATRLYFDKDDAPQTVQFVVLGRNPRFVFRMEDFMMMFHWEHDMSVDDETEIPRQPAVGPSPAPL